MSVATVRGKDWVFSAFWVACGEANAPKCAVNIPVTCLFKDGKPFKTVWTDDTGIVKRIMLEDVSLDRETSERGYRGTSVRTLRALRKVLIEYGLQKGYRQAQEDIGQKPFICNVRQTLQLWVSCAFNISLHLHAESSHSKHRCFTWTARSRRCSCTRWTHCCARTPGAGR